MSYYHHHIFLYYVYDDFGLLENNAELIMNTENGKSGKIFSLRPSFQKVHIA
jgi:hypothetical protein